MGKARDDQHLSGESQIISSVEPRKNRQSGPSLAYYFRMEHSLTVMLRLHRHGEYVFILPSSPADGRITPKRQPINSRNPGEPQAGGMTIGPALAREVRDCLLGG